MKHLCLTGDPAMVDIGGLHRFRSFEESVLSSREWGNGQDIGRMQVGRRLYTGRKEVVKTKDEYE